MTDAFEMQEPDGYLQPKKYRIKCECALCGTVYYSKWAKAPPKKDPPCPNKRCIAIAETAQLRREVENLKAMLQSGHAPATIGNNPRVQAVDKTADIVMTDYKMTDLKDNIRMGDSMAPKLPGPMQIAADTYFGAGKTPVLGATQGRRGYVDNKFLKRVGARALGGSYRANSVAPNTVGADRMHLASSRPNDQWKGR
jgi:hypothetical protein